MGSNDEVSNCRMTRSAYNQKKFVDRRMTRSEFLELQKQRQGDGKPQQRRRQKKKKIKNNTLTGRDRYVRDFTPEEREVYNKRVRESEGFDVGEIPDEVILNPVIREIPLDPRCSIIVYSTTSAKTALRDYNKDNHTKYQFVKLVRVCYRLAMGNMYYITFQAKQNGITRNFQARVREFLGMHIEFCREEKKPNLTEGRLTDFQHYEILLKLVEQFDLFNHRINALESRPTQRKVTNNLLMKSKMGVTDESKRVGVPQSKKSCTQNSTCSKEGRDQNQTKVKDGHIFKDEKALIEDPKEPQHSPVVALKEPLNVPCVAAVGESKELVVGHVLEMFLKVSNLSSEFSSESTALTAIADHQSSMSLVFKNAKDNLNEVILKDCETIKDEMLPIEESGNFLEDARVESEESSVPSSNKTNEVKQTVSSLESDNPSEVTRWLPKLADLVQGRHLSSREMLRLVLFLLWLGKYL
ncbi:hypothetical protein RHGRI_020303 [Rhododendron griersonianum]|uniref:Cystatin domain-containing protein n=1 Tax=Rhododendron griersonianum TaxID=479676 RepID=A0AAV6JHV2_9ERIC|nr:hypothetical protein RHGRI_020303 [Rhododendron griersonianum]